MSIDNIIAQNCKQTAVYWGTPSRSFANKMTFAAAVEIDCRWQSKKEVVTNAEGKEIVSMAQVFVKQDLDEEGYLYLGELDDFDSTVDTADPVSIENAFEIKVFDKTPELGSTTVFVRKAFL